MAQLLKKCVQNLQIQTRLVFARQTFGTRHTSPSILAPDGLMGLGGPPGTMTVVVQVRSCRVTAPDGRQEEELEGSSSEQQTGTTSSIDFSSAHNASSLQGPVS